MANKDVYFKGREFVYINLNNEFIYESAVFCRFKNYYSLINQVYYKSPKYLKIVKTFKYNSCTIIRAGLCSAPLWWIEENGFIKYVKPVKKKKIFNELVVTKKRKK